MKRRSVVVVVGAVVMPSDKPLSRRHFPIVIAPSESATDRRSLFPRKVSSALNGSVLHEQVR